MQNFRSVHLSARAQLMVERTAPSPDGRVTPGCTGLAYRCIVAFVHASGQAAKIGLHLGHCGPRGSTQVGWDRADEPLTKGNWPPRAAKPVCDRTDQTPFAEPRPQRSGRSNHGGRHICEGQPRPDTAAGGAAAAMRCFKYY